MRCDACVERANLFIAPRDVGFERQSRSLHRLEPRLHFVAVLAEFLQGLVECPDLVGKRMPVGQPDLGAQLLQPVGVFLVASRLGGLRANRAETTVDLVDDVRQAEHVLVDALEPTSCFELFRLESTDASRFLKDRTAVLGRGLQHHVDLALFDDAVRLGGDAGPRKQIANVAQPTGLMIDQVFTFAAPIDSPGDMHFRRVHAEYLI